jgi:hypothetical protein
MNTNGLVNMYQFLTAKERVPLILAAQKRGDELEQQRLTASAPHRLLQMPDYRCREQMVHVLTLIYVTEQQDRLIEYWHSKWRLDIWEEERVHCLIMLQTNAYLFCCGAEAWRRFCQEQNLDPEQLTAANYRGWILGDCAKIMPEVAPSRERLEDMLKSYGRPTKVTVTADTMLEGWRKAMADFEAKDADTNGRWGAPTRCDTPSLPLPTSAFHSAVRQGQTGTNV